MAGSSYSSPWFAKLWCELSIRRKEIPGGRGTHSSAGKVLGMLERIGTRGHSTYESQWRLANSASDGSEEQGADRAQSRCEEPSREPAGTGHCCCSSQSNWATSKCPGPTVPPMWTWMLKEEPHAKSFLSCLFYLFGGSCSKRVDFLDFIWIKSWPFLEFKCFSVSFGEQPAREPS